jgi:hypothetical protein
MEYVWCLILVTFASAVAYFSSTVITGEQRRLEWEAYARTHQCSQSRADPKVWMCLSPMPTWFEVK